MKAAEVAPAWMEALPTVGETFVAKLDNKDDVDSGLHDVERSRSQQATADPEGSLKDAGAAPKGGGLWSARTGEY